MLTTVHKFDLPMIDGTFELMLPVDAELLCVQMQFERPVLWARVNPHDPLVAHAFAICGTGNPCPPASVARYVGTVQQYGGSLIWHVFHGGVR